MADNIKIHRRKNRPGLLYDESLPGFEPALWPHVIWAPPSGESAHRVLLGGVGGYEGSIDGREGEGEGPLKVGA